MQEIIKNGLINGSPAMTALALLLTAIEAYLLGGLNFGVIISSLRYHDDVRKHGSGNAGMTNMLRTYGKSAAVFTLIGDVLKAVAAIYIGCFIAGENAYAPYVAALFCILGHVYPIYYGFKGGKGVAVAAASVLVIDPVIFLILFAIFAIIVGFTKYVSLGSIMCMFIFPILMARMNGYGLHVIFSMIIALFVIFCHRTNFVRLLNHTESKISFSKKKKESDKSDGK
jgi:glycerol-3-phosphate acyltransferase PlsY